MSVRVRVKTPNTDSSALAKSARILPGPDPKLAGKVFKADRDRLPFPDPELSGHELMRQRKDIDLPKIEAD